MNEKKSSNPQQLLFEKIMMKNEMQYKSNEVDIKSNIEKDLIYKNERSETD